MSFVTIAIWNFTFNLEKKKQSTFCSISHQKSLKIPNSQSESVNQSRTNNTMASRKGTKGQTTIYKTLHNNVKDRVARTPLITGGELMCKVFGLQSIYLRMEIGDLVKRFIV